MGWNRPGAGVELSLKELQVDGNSASFSRRGEVHHIQRPLTRERPSEYLRRLLGKRTYRWKNPHVLITLSLVVAFCLLLLVKHLHLETDLAGPDGRTHSEQLAPFREVHPDARVIIALQDLCNKTEWHEGLFFYCTNNAGGIGNVAARILACIQFAVDAGAGIILPHIARRNEDLSQVESSGIEPFSYLFDEDWFRANLALSCPQMTLLSNITDVPNFSQAHLPPVLKPLDFTDNSWLNFEVEQFPKHLQTWLPRSPTALKPILVRLGAAIFEYPARRNEDLYSSYAQILKFHDRAYTLGYRAFSALTNKKRFAQAAYLGAHLRTEVDIAGLDLWASFEAQRDTFFDMAQEKGLRIIYVASGDRDELDRIRKDAEQVNLTVVNKFDLLDDQSRTELSALSFDQQALVDYLILRNSTFFVGSSPSSFSFELAYSRHKDTSTMFFEWPNDSRSHIMGEDFLFARHGMWPLADSL